MLAKLNRQNGSSRASPISSDKVMSWLRINAPRCLGVRAICGRWLFCVRVFCHVAETTRPAAFSKSFSSAIYSFSVCYPLGNDVAEKTGLAPETPPSLPGFALPSGLPHTVSGKRILFHAPSYLRESYHLVAQTSKR